jgi:molybdate transport system substrate-binding protein
MTFRRFFSMHLSVVLLGIVCIHPALKGQSEPHTTVTVFAAASLNDVFKAAGHNFENNNPGISLSFNFAGSQQLVQQIVEGAPADIFASANIQQMQKAAASGRIDTTSEKIFAHNVLVVIAPKSSSQKVQSLHDLTLPGLKIVLADKAVPVGHYTIEFLDKCDKDKQYGWDFKANVIRNVVSYEENVRAVLSKVELGECDAGVVYATDAATDTLNRISTITIPDDLNVVADYPIAVLGDSNHREAAEKFLDYVLSDACRSLLERYGFTPPLTAAEH